MDDLGKWILSLADQKSHLEMFAALSRKAAEFEGIANRISKRTGAEGDRRHDALSRSRWLGQILFFLRTGLDAQHATDADKELCTKIKDRLAARGEWKPPEGQ